MHIQQITQSKIIENALQQIAAHMLPRGICRIELDTAEQKVKQGDICALTTALISSTQVASARIRPPQVQRICIEADVA